MNPGVFTVYFIINSRGVFLDNLSNGKRLAIIEVTIIITNKNK